MKSLVMKVLHSADMRLRHPHPVRTVQQPGLFALDHMMACKIDHVEAFMLYRVDQCGSKTKFSHVCIISILNAKVQNP